MKKGVFLFFIILLLLLIGGVAFWYFYLVRGEKLEWTELNLLGLEDSSFIKTAVRRSDYLIDLEVPEEKAYTAIYSFSVTAGFDLSRVTKEENKGQYTLIFPQPEIYSVDNEGQPLILNDIGSEEFPGIIRRNKILGAEFVRRNALKQGILEQAKKELLNSYPKMVSQINGVLLERINILFVKDAEEINSDYWEFQSPLAPIQFSFDPAQEEEWVFERNTGDHPEMGNTLVAGVHPESGTQFSIYPFLILEKNLDDFFRDRKIPYGKIFNSSRPDLPIYSWRDNFSEGSYLCLSGGMLYRLDISSPSSEIYDRYSALPLLLFSESKVGYSHPLLETDFLYFPLSYKYESNREVLIKNLLSRFEGYQISSESELGWNRFSDLLFLEEVPVFFDKSQVSENSWNNDSIPPQEIREIDDVLKAAFIRGTEDDWKMLEKDLIAVFYDTGGFFGRERIFGITRDSIFYQYISFSEIAGYGLKSVQYPQFTPENREGKLIPFSGSGEKITSKEISSFIMFLKSSGFFML